MTFSISMKSFNFNNIEQLIGGGISSEPRIRKKITEDPRSYIHHYRHTNSPKQMCAQDMKVAIENTKQVQTDSTQYRVDLLPCNWETHLSQAPQNGLRPKNSLADIAGAINANDETKENENPKKPSSVSKEDEVILEIKKHR